MSTSSKRTKFCWAFMVLMFAKYFLWMLHYATVATQILDSRREHEYNNCSQCSLSFDVPAQQQDRYEQIGSEHQPALISTYYSTHKKQQKPFVLYAANFGSHRDEEDLILLGSIQAFAEYPYTDQFDRFLFTDSERIGEIPGWTLVRMPTPKDQNGIPGYRLAIKQLKFQGHPLLEDYRYRIHVDTHPGALFQLRLALKNGLLNHVQCHSRKRGTGLFLRRHPNREYLQQEMEILKDFPNLQPTEALLKWQAVVEPLYQDLNAVPMTENNLFVIDSLHADITKQWASIYDILLKHGLWRDQIVYAYAMHDVQHDIQRIQPTNLTFCPESDQYDILQGTTGDDGDWNCDQVTQSDVGEVSHRNIRNIHKTDQDPTSWWREIYRKQKNDDISLSPSILKLLGLSWKDHTRSNLIVAKRPSLTGKILWERVLSNINDPPQSSVAGSERQKWDIVVWDHEWQHHSVSQRNTLWRSITSQLHPQQGRVLIRIGKNPYPLLKELRLEAQCYSIQILQVEETKSGLLFLLGFPTNHSKDTVALKPRDMIRHKHQGTCLVGRTDPDWVTCRPCHRKGITVGLLYYNNVEYLTRIVQEWSTWSKPSQKDTEFLVVDDGSEPGKSAQTILKRLAATSNMPLPEVRILTILDDLAWNIGGARNLVMHSATSCRVAMLDDDYLLPEELARELGQLDSADKIYRLPRNHPGKSEFHPGIMYMTSSLYFSIGGCDEDFVGHYGYTDPHLAFRAEQQGVSVEGFLSNFKLQPQPEAAQSDSTSDGRGPSKKPKYNLKLFQAKASAEVPWSTSYLRFRWKDSHGRSQISTLASYLQVHPNRADFADAFRHGWYQTGLQIGAGSGRFTEHLLQRGRPETWYLLEPHPGPYLASRLADVKEIENYSSTADAQEMAFETWETRGIGSNTNLHFLPIHPTDPKVFELVPVGSIDFVYFDESIDYITLINSLEEYYQLLRPGGMIAGGGYQYGGHDFEPRTCAGCFPIPLVSPFTEYGVRVMGKDPQENARSHGSTTVRAVQDWLAQKHRKLQLSFTLEDFSRQSLADQGMDYDLIIEETRNPSWFVLKRPAKYKKKKT